MSVRFGCRSTHAAVAAVWMLGCSAAESPPRNAGAAVATMEPGAVACAPGDTALFPTAALQEREGWYGKHLRAAGEGRLCARANVDEAYRFTWLRTFAPPVVVRVERLRDGYTLTAKQLDGAGGYEPGRLVVNRTVPLGPAEWRRMHVLLDSAGLWSPAPPREDASPGLDGARWILEGVRGSEYRAVDRWSPTETGPDRHIRATGLYLLQVAGLTPRDPRQIY